MSQNSNTTLSSDSNILYSLITDCDSREDDENDSTTSNSEDGEDYDSHEQMESDSREETSDSDVDSHDSASDNIDMDMVADEHQNIQWSRKIVQQSNLYATQNNFKQKPMNNLDLYRLIGFLFYSSLCKLPCKSDYWSASFGPEIVMKNITRDRVDELLRSLHFNDNILQAQPGEKIQPLIELFNSQCYSVVEQEQNVSVDEQMIGYKGKTAPKHYKQYLSKNLVSEALSFGLYLEFLHIHIK
jgi:hypothetical protein